MDQNGARWGCFAFEAVVRRVAAIFGYGGAASSGTNFADGRVMMENQTGTSTTSHWGNKAE